MANSARTGESWTTETPIDTNAMDHEEQEPEGSRGTDDTRYTHIPEEELSSLGVARPQRGNIHLTRLPWEARDGT
jgi:hypothetical protein